MALSPFMYCRHPGPQQSYYCTVTVFRFYAGTADFYSLISNIMQIFDFEFLFFHISYIFFV